MNCGQSASRLLCESAGICILLRLQVASQTGCRNAVRGLLSHKFVQGWQAGRQTYKGRVVLTGADADAAYLASSLLLLSCGRVSCAWLHQHAAALPCSCQVSCPCVDGRAKG